MQISKLQVKIFGVRQHWSKDIKTNDISITISNPLNLLKDENIELYVSIDVDAIDKNFASATGTPEPDGLMPDDAMNILRALAPKYAITGADMMGIAPFTDSLRQGIAGRDKTLKVVADISEYLLKEIAK